MSRRIRVILVVLALLGLLLVVGVDYAIENVLSYSPIRPHRVTVEEVTRYNPTLLSPAGFTQVWEEFDITVEDTVHLKGWFIPSVQQPARGTIVVLHGIASTRIAMLPTARMLVQNGFNCLLYDSRANGESGGLNCTFGFYEKHDLSAYLDSALARYPGCEPLGILGDSFGAAVALQAMAIDKRLTCGVAESPFATLREVIHDYFRQRFFVPLDFISDEAMEHSERIAHFSVDSVRPVEAARHILQPTMIVHGGSDHKISADYGRRVYENLASTHKELYIIESAGHDDLAEVGGPEYRRRIIDFFTKYLARPAPPA